jgi:hypothetical protein
LLGVILLCVILEIYLVLLLTQFELYEELQYALFGLLFLFLDWSVIIENYMFLAQDYFRVNLFLFLCKWIIFLDRCGVLLDLCGYALHALAK